MAPRHVGLANGRAPHPGVGRRRLCRANAVPYVLLLEDDFVWCPLALPHLYRALRLARAAAAAAGHHDILALRVSYGNNGLVLPCAHLPAILRQAELGKTLAPLDSYLGKPMPHQAACTGQGLTGQASRSPCHCHQL